MPDPQIRKGHPFTNRFQAGAIDKDRTLTRTDCRSIAIAVTGEIVDIARIALCHAGTDERTDRDDPSLSMP